MPKTALVTGANGQIGSYLSEILLEKGYNVFGFVRKGKEEGLVDRVEPLFGDLEDLSSLEKAISESFPDEIYNLAALSNARISINEPEYTMKVNLLPVIKICEVAKKLNPRIKVFQAGSAEFYGNMSGVVDENTPFDPKNPYAIAKLAAFQFIKYCREMQGLFACNGIIFNSESSKRSTAFVTRKITNSAVRIKRGELDKLALGNLNSQRDWIHAKDTANAIYQIMQQPSSSDYVISLGEGHTVREFVENAFKYSGMNISWKGEGVNEKGYDKNGKLLVEVNPEFFRPDDRVIKGNNSKLKSIGWKPKYSFPEIIKEMVEFDLL
ncbi:MAG: GDP-mannose 4,6-dehydratase [Nanoarchaeota archaeon]|nr:GDP-mannose 4,6-dehydratase [Nanoarchaeota archaeon]